MLSVPDTVVVCGVWTAPNKRESPKRDTDLFGVAAPRAFSFVGSKMELLKCERREHRSIQKLHFSPHAPFSKKDDPYNAI